MAKVQVMSESNGATPFEVGVSGVFDPAAADRVLRSVARAPLESEPRIDFSGARSIDMRGLYALATGLAGLGRSVLLVGLSQRDARLLQYLGVAMPPRDVAMAG